MNIVQLDIIEINEGLRLRKYDGHYELFLPCYQDPEAIIDESRMVFSQKTLHS